MDNTNESQEFDLDDILREFHEDPDDDVKDTASEEELDVAARSPRDCRSPRGNPRPGFQRRHRPL